MDVLVNASNLFKGGGVQVAASFVVESLANPKGISWHYALSRAVADEVTEQVGLPVRVEVFESSPARDRQQRQRLQLLEASIEPDIVFSVFGPAYVNFQAPHLLGVAAGWVTHSSQLAYSMLPSWVGKFKTMLASIYKGYWLRRANRWVVEADNARLGMRKRLALPLSKVDVVPNACASLFLNADIAPAKRPEQGDTVRLIYVSANYPHKNIPFVPRVARELKKLQPELDFKFVLTLPPGEADLALGDLVKLGVEQNIENVGRVSLTELVELYRKAHICFMPSVLETFSATYVEAMALGRPIIASDLDFAHAVCEDAARYIDPADPSAAARSIVELLASEGIWNECIRRGNSRLAELPTARQRYEMYIESIRATVSGENNIAAEIEREI
jgi:glycosyltransferase involved in cell wall biosynthesis